MQLDLLLADLERLFFLAMVFLDLAKILLRRLALHGLQDLRAVFLHLSRP